MKWDKHKIKRIILKSIVLFWLLCELLYIIRKSAGRFPAPWPHFFMLWKSNSRPAKNHSIIQASSQVAARWMMIENHANQYCSSKVRAVSQFHQYSGKWAAMMPVKAFISQETSRQESSSSLKSTEYAVMTARSSMSQYETVPKMWMFSIPNIKVPPLKMNIYLKLVERKMGIRQPYGYIIIITYM